MQMRIVITIEVQGDSTFKDDAGKYQTGDYLGAILGHLGQQIRGDYLALDDSFKIRDWAEKEVGSLVVRAYEPDRRVEK